MAGAGRPPMTALFRDLRIIDLTMGWAGPLTTMMFADLGADVIKIEGPENPDWWRAGSVAAPKADFSNAAQRNWDRSPLFNSVNRNKRSLVLDFKSEKGRELLLRLIAEADVVIESFSPHVMPRNRLGYEELKAVNPRLIMVSMPAVGRDGPWNHYVGYASTTEALAGFPAVCGYPDEPVLQALRVADPFGGLNGACALALALFERESTGKGQFVEVSQLEAMVPLLGSALMEFALNETVPERRPFGPASKDHAPFGVYPAAGSDQWVVVAVEDDEEWSRLCRAIGRLDLLRDSALATAAGRVLSREAVDDAVSAFTRRGAKHEVAQLLRKAGVHAAAVNTSLDLPADPQTRHVFEPVDHPLVGSHPYPRVTCRFSLTPGEIRRPAPMFGEHNAEVLAEFLGLPPDQIADLQGRGIITDVVRQRSSDSTAGKEVR